MWLTSVVDNFGTAMQIGTLTLTLLLIVFVEFLQWRSNINREKNLKNFNFSSHITGSYKSDGDSSAASLGSKF